MIQQKKKVKFHIAKRKEETVSPAGTTEPFKRVKDE